MATDVYVHNIFTVVPLKILYFSVGLDAGYSLTCLGHLHQFIITEFVQVLLHLRDGLSDGAKGEVRVDAHCGQLLSLSLGYQHVVGLKRKQQQH